MTEIDRIIEEQEQQLVRPEYDPTPYEVEHPGEFDSETAMRAAREKSPELLNTLMASYKRAEPVMSPEQMRKAQFASGLTDTFRTLSQLFQHGQGARVKEYDGQKSSSATTNQRLQQYIDRYHQMLERDNAYERQMMDKAFMLNFQNEKEKHAAGLRKWERDENRHYNDQRAKYQADLSEHNRLQGVKDREDAAEKAHQRSLDLLGVRETNIRTRPTKSGGSGTGTGGTTGNVLSNPDTGRTVRFNNTTNMNSALTHVYRELVARGLIQELTRTVKQYGVELNEPDNDVGRIAKYMKQPDIIASIPDDLWSYLEGYTAGGATINPQQYSESNSSGDTIELSEEAFEEQPVAQAPQKKQVTEPQQQNTSSSWWQRNPRDNKAKSKPMAAPQGQAKFADKPNPLQPR